MESVFGFLTTLGAGWISLIILTVLIFLLIAKPSINWKDGKISFRKSNKDRSCFDCITLLNAKRLGYEVAYWSKQNCLLREQLTYAEQKEIELEILLGYELNKNFHNEIRRSMKENNFGEGPAFQAYLDSRHDYLLSLLKYTPSQQPLIEKIIDEIYINAKSVKERIQKELKEMEDKFSKEIDEMVGL